MPELPDVTIYVEHLASRTVGQELRTVRLKSPFLLRTFSPPLSSAFGKKVQAVRRLGKRIVFALEGSRLLREDWPRTLEELEEFHQTASSGAAKAKG